MKLIIEIPEDVVTAIQNGQDYRYDIHTAIVQGISYEERPHGEWEEVFEHNGKIYHKCNQCHISSPLMVIDRYCSYCGAKMKGGKE